MVTASSHVKHFVAGGAAIMIGFATVGGGIAAAGSSHSVKQEFRPVSNTAQGPLPSWKTNANGQTYGSELDSTSLATDPTLVGAIATNGATGYVYSAQLNQPLPSSPAAAVSQQAAATGARYIPVYAQDGTTVIGQFEASEPANATLAAPTSTTPAGP